MPKTQKQKTSDAMSKYVRLRDALAYCSYMTIDLRQFGDVKELPVKCFDCREIRPWIRMDAGHWLGRGKGGGSGVYFDERNVHTQAKTCNRGFEGSVAQRYSDFMLREYGQKILDELRFLHKNHLYKAKDLIGLEIYYKQEYEKLVAEFQGAKNETI